MTTYKRNQVDIELLLAQKLLNVNIGGKGNRLAVDFQALYPQV